VAEPSTFPEAASIVEVPAATPDAKPELLIVATDVLPELQVMLLNACVLPSVYVPVAVNCWVVR
jgi:hypothetical protein